jgi:2-C-methyl-D-erythritol 4-phosphate cytidylyltransferase
VAVALLVAAGRGTRLGSGGPKALVAVAGRPMLDWSLDALRAVAEVEQIVVALPEGVPAPAGTIGVPGGAERSHSVLAALRASTGDPVVVHDAARPLVTPEIVRATLAALLEHGCDAAIAAAPVHDTVKRAAAGVVRGTLDRSELWAVQTPQVFRRAALERALAADHDALAGATDDAALVEAQGGTVRVVESSPENLKVTTRHDLRVAEFLLYRRSGLPESQAAPSE